MMVDLNEWREGLSVKKYLNGLKGSFELSQREEEFLCVDYGSLCLLSFPLFYAFI